MYRSFTLAAAAAMMAVAVATTADAAAPNLGRAPLGEAISNTLPVEQARIRCFTECRGPWWHKRCRRICVPVYPRYHHWRRW